MPREHGEERKGSHKPDTIHLEAVSTVASFATLGRTQRGQPGASIACFHSYFILHYDTCPS